ncbi:hypothetical protein [Fictibacillus sp. KU28468]
MISIIPVLLGNGIRLFAKRRMKADFSL